MSSMFNGCSSLTVFSLGANWKANVLGAGVGLPADDKWMGSKTTHQTLYASADILTGSGHADTWYKYQGPTDASANGISGGVGWYITSANASSNPNQLVVYPANGVSGTMASDANGIVNWLNSTQKAGIKSADFRLNVIAGTSLKNTFQGCSKLTDLVFFFLK